MASEPQGRWRRAVGKLRATVAPALWAVLGATGCGGANISQDDNGEPLAHDTHETRPVPGEVFAALPAVREPTLIRRVAGQLWVRDAAGDPWLHVLAERTGELLLSMGRRGDGPGQFDYLAQMEPAFPNDDLVWLFDPPLSRFTIMEFRKGIAVPITVDTLALSTVSRATGLKDGRILGMTSTQERRFAIFSQRGQLIKSVAGPLLGGDTVPTMERIRASYAFISLCPAPTDGFILAYGSAGRVEFYGDQGQAEYLAHVPHATEPVFERKEGEYPEFTHPRSHYVDCVSTSDDVFALYSGRAAAEYSPSVMDSGEFVHVFDGEGMLRVVFRLEYAVRSIDVSADGQWLYGVSVSNGNVYRFALSPNEDQ